MALGSTRLSLWRKLVPGIFLGVKSGRRVGLTTLPPSMSWMSENVGASTSCNPKGLHGLYIDSFTYLYLFLPFGSFRAITSRIYFALGEALLKVPLCPYSMQTSFYLMLIHSEPFSQSLCLGNAPFKGQVTPTLFPFPLLCLSEPHSHSFICLICIFITFATLGLFLYPEDGSNMLMRNFSLYLTQHAASDDPRL
jgi:hypothetical protein